MGVIYALFDKRQQTGLLVVSESIYRYIGQSKGDGSERLDEHKNNSKNKSLYSQQDVHKWIAEIGEDNVEMTIVSEPSDNHLDLVEQFWIDKIRAIREKNGFTPLLNERNQISSSGLLGGLGYNSSGLFGGLLGGKAYQTATPQNTLPSPLQSVLQNKLNQIRQANPFQNKLNGSK